MNAEKDCSSSNQNIDEITAINGQQDTEANDLLQGQILPSLLKLSYPILIAMFFITVFNIVDTFYVSRLGNDAITAMSFTFPIYMFLIAIGAGLTIGVSSAVARALGAGEKEFAAETGKQGVALALSLGLLITLGGTWLSPRDPFIHGRQRCHSSHIYDYVQVIILAGIAKYLYIFDGTLREEGHTGCFPCGCCWPPASAILSSILFYLWPLVFPGWK